MVTTHLTILSLVLPSIVYSVCDNYWQSTDYSSTKRPFGACYHSEIDESLSRSSYRYICNQSNLGANYTINGFTAFREEYSDIECNGEVTSSVPILQPYKINCGSTCDVLRLRQHPITNASLCEYNASVYVEDIIVVGVCDDNDETSEAFFCNKKEEKKGSYFWINTYYGNMCEERRIFEAAYQFHGCQGDGVTYLEVLSCDASEEGLAPSVQPFEDSVFLAGFLLLIFAILAIIGVLVWYCCWFKESFYGSIQKSERKASAGNRQEQEQDDGDRTTIYV